MTDAGDWASMRPSPDSLSAPHSRSSNQPAPVAPIADLRVLPELLTVAETATVLRVGRSWVYEHSTELGAIKLGSGRTAPLRIPRDAVRRLVELDPGWRERRSSPARGGKEPTASDIELQARPRL